MSNLRQKQQQQQDAVNSSVNQNRFLVTRVALADDQDPYYNAQSQIVLLRDPQGNLHRSQMSGEYLKVYPNGAVHDLLWFHFEEDESEIIDTPPENLVEGAIQGHCYLIPRRNRDPRIEAVNASVMTSQTVRDSTDRRTILPGVQGTGIAIGQEEGTITMVGPGQTELVIGRDGIHSTHQIDSTAMRSKGIFAENPLASVVPETIVTFPYARKEVPDLTRIRNIAGILSGVTKALKTLKSIQNLVK